MDCTQRNLASCTPQGMAGTSTWPPLSKTLFSHFLVVPPKCGLRSILSTLIGSVGGGRACILGVL